MSHFIKDEEGNYHEYSDEQYAELQQEKARIANGLSSVAVMGLGLFLGAIPNLLFDASVFWWIGIGVSLLGAYQLKKYTTKVGFIILVILAIIAYYGAYWFVSEIHSYMTETKTSQIIKESDMPQTIYFYLSGGSQEPLNTLC